MNKKYWVVVIVTGIAMLLSVLFGAISIGYFIAGWAGLPQQATLLLGCLVAGIVGLAGGVLITLFLHTARL